VDDDLAAFNDLHGELAAIKQRHSEERVGFNGMDRDDTGLAMPQSDRFVDLEGVIGPISKNTLSTTFPGQPQPGHVRLRESERACKACIDDRLRLKSPT